MTTLDEIEARFERADKAQDAYLEGRSIYAALTRSVACTGDVPKLVTALRNVEALCADPEHLETHGPHDGYVSVKNLRRAIRRSLDG